MEPVRMAVALRAAALSLAFACAATGCAAAPADPIAQEIAHWQARVRDDTTTVGLWGDARTRGGAALARADSALQQGRRWLALLRLASTRDDLAASWYVHGHPAPARDSLGFEAEWTRVGRELAGELDTPKAGTLAGVAPAAVRAIGEATLPRTRVYYDASVEYGRNTMPQYGLYYIGAALAQREFVELVRRAGHATGPAAPVRDLTAELDAHERELLRLYRPPLSIERHPDFITASALLKEARELNALGLHHGAQLRWLQSVQRTAMLRGGPVPGGDTLAAALKAQRTRLASVRGDRTIGEMFLQAADADLAAGPGAIATAVVAEVMPAWFAAQGPAPAQAARAAPEVTVTLVRWPYT
jgi:hypothetical protein